MNTFVEATRDATADAYDQAMAQVQQSGLPAGWEHERDEFGLCQCVRPRATDQGHVSSETGRWVSDTRVRPQADCFWCQGSGYALVKRIIRPIPKPDFSEQAALAQLKTKDALLLRAAKTLDYNADILMAAAKNKEAAQTKQAAQAIREAVGEEG